MILGKESKELVLTELETDGTIEINEDGLSTVVQDYGSRKQLSEQEVCFIILPHIVANVGISNRQLAKDVGLNVRTVTKYRNSDTFITLMAQWCNKEIVALRGTAMVELKKILTSPTTSDGNKIKAIHEALSHSERMTELFIEAGKTKDSALDVDVLLKELEGLL